MKLLGSTENKITKDKNGENITHLEITEVGLVHCNIFIIAVIVIMIIHKIQEFYTHMFQIYNLVI